MRQAELLTRFEDYLRYEKRYSLHTLEGYIRDNSQFFAFLLLQYGQETLNETTHHQIRSWLVSLLKNKMSSASVRRKMSSIAHLFKWMRQSDLIQHNPVLKVQLPKIPQRLPKSIPAASISRLWTSLEDHDDSYNLIRDQALIGLLYGCGLRRSELINLTWQDYDESRKTLRVIGKGRKYRQVPVNEPLKHVLKSLKGKVEENPLLQSHIQIILMNNGKPCYPKFVHNKVVELLGTVTTADKKSPHVLRHSMATHLMDGGAELNAVKELLGHASLAATQVYTHNSISRLREVYNLSHPNARKS